MGDLAGMLAEGGPMVTRAMEAIRRFHEARDSSIPIDEVERLKDEAVALMKDLSVFQMEALERIVLKV